MARLALFLGSLVLACVVFFQLGPRQPEVSADPANPYRWADLAESKLEQGRAKEAEALMEKAVWLAPNVPPILMRATNLFLRTGKAEDVLKYSLRTLELVPGYDGVIFGYYEQLPLFPINRLNRRALDSYLRYAITRQNTKQISAIWELLKKNSFATKQLAAEVASYYAARRDYRQGNSVWRQVNCPKSPGNCFGPIFNGGFETAPLAMPFDWTVPAAASIDDSSPRSGQRSLHIKFDGQANLDWAGPEQTVVIDAGRYEASWHLKTENLTTNEGIRVRVFGAGEPVRLDQFSESVTGATGWTRRSLRFVVGQPTNSVIVQFRRNPSVKLDNKIKGQAWIDDVSVDRIH